MAAALSNKGPCYASDAHPALIALYSAVRAGWQPPETVSEAEYQAAKALPDSDPMKAFCGFGLSYGGKWFGGYARAKPGHGDFHAYAWNGLRRDCPKLAGVACLDWLTCEPAPTDCLVYLDPPYAGTTRYAQGAFDHALFLQLAIGWSQHTHVFVSEYAFPFGYCVAELAASAEKRLKPGSVERLFFLPKGYRP